jgi:hypothetical protein
VAIVQRRHAAKAIAARVFIDPSSFCDSLLGYNHRRTAVSATSTSATSTEESVITIIDLNSELAKLPILRGRRPETTEAERKASGAFVTLSPFRDGNIFSAKFAGDAAWERHPKGDELVQVV